MFNNAPIGIQNCGCCYTFCHGITQFLTFFTLFFRGGGSGGAGDTIAPPIFLDMKKKVVFSTPHISRLKK